MERAEHHDETGEKSAPHKRNASYSTIWITNTVKTRLDPHDVIDLFCIEKFYFWLNNIFHILW